MNQALRLNSVVASDKGHSVQLKKITGSWLGRDDAIFWRFGPISRFFPDLSTILVRFWVDFSMIFRVTLENAIL